MNIDCAFNIAIRSKYKLIRKFNCVSKYFNNVWYFACKEQFPDKKYFHFWTGYENYMVMYRTYFCLAINTRVEKELYEWDPMLLKILHLSYDIIAYGTGYNIHTLLKFKVQNQYILLLNDETYEWAIVSQHTDHQSAEDAMYQLIKCKHFKQKYEAARQGEEIEMIIVNLEDLTPVFFGIKQNIDKKYVKQSYYMLNFPTN